MQKLILSLLLVVSFSFNGSSQETVSIGNMNQFQTFYSLEIGSVKKLHLDDWDIAIEPQGDYAIRINESKGVRAWVKTDELYENGTLGSNYRGLQDYEIVAYDTTGMVANVNSWEELHNDYASWKVGALNQEKAITTDLTNYGWGGYKGFSSDPMHAILGYRIFIVKYDNGLYKQFFVRKSLSAGYEFAIANLDGSNKQELMIDRADYTAKYFAYLALKDGSIHNLEPEKTTWDLLFKDYPSDKATGDFTNKPGVLINHEQNSLAFDDEECETPANLFPDWKTSANTIGTTWGSDNASCNCYLATHPRSYYVQNLEDITYKLIFNMCTFEGDFLFNKNVYEANELSIQLAKTNETCFECEDGSSFVTVTGGTCPFNYQWSNGETITDVDNLAPGWYTVSVTDADELQATDSIEILPFVCDLEVERASTIIPNCFDGNDGSININYRTSNEPATIIWSNGETSFTVENLSSDEYHYTIYDAKNCVWKDTIMLTQPDELIITVDKTDESCNNCNDGEAEINIVGGVAPCKVTWSTGDTITSIYSLQPGNYQVFVSDVNGCAKQVTFTIESYECQLAIESTLEINPVCFNTPTGSVEINALNAAEPISYEWSNGVFTSSNNNIPSGTYTITVVDGKFCEATQSFSLIDPAAIYVDYTINSVSCNGCADAIINVNPIGGTGNITITWNDTTIKSLERINLSSGTYTFTVTDENGCTVTRSVTINNFDCDLTVTDLIEKPVSCFGGKNGEVTMVATSSNLPINYNWTTGRSLASEIGLAAGNYEVELTDQNGCSTTLYPLVSQPSELTINAQTTYETCFECKDGLATISVTGGKAPYTYEWQTGHNVSVYENLSPGVYFVVVTDVNGCTSSKEVKILEFNCNLKVYGAEIKHSTCFGEANGEILPHISGAINGISYLWSTGYDQQTIENLRNGTYQLIVTDGKGCKDTSNFTMIEPDKLSATASITEASCSSCNDGSVFANVNGGTAPYTYDWSTGDTTQAITNKLPGVYSLDLIDANYCQTTLYDTISFSTVGINEGNSVASKMLIYPNPSNGKVFIKALAQNVQLVIYNAQGQEVDIKHAHQNGNQLQLNLESGWYLVKITSNSATETKRIIIN
jgi:hypothetical protein